MAFFSLTQLGPQDPFHSVNSKNTPPKDQQSKSTKDVITLPGTVGPSYSQPLPSFTSQLYGKNDKPPAGHGGSFNKLSQMRTKHQRNEKGKYRCIYALCALIRLTNIAAVKLLYVRLLRNVGSS